MGKFGLAFLFGLFLSLPFFLSGCIRWIKCCFYHVKRAVFCCFTILLPLRVNPCDIIDMFLVWAGYPFFFSINHLEWVLFFLLLYYIILLILVFRFTMGFLFSFCSFFKGSGSWCRGIKLLFLIIIIDFLIPLLLVICILFEWPWTTKCSHGNWTLLNCMIALIHPQP